MSGRGHREIFADDIEWTTGEGGVRYMLVSMDEADLQSPMITIVNFPAGYELTPHTHDSDYFEYVIEGDITVGKTRYGAGDIRVVKGGHGYGPLRVGEQGCKAMIVFRDGSRHAMEPLPRVKDRSKVIA